MHNVGGPGRVIAHLGRINEFRCGGGNDVVLGDGLLWTGHELLQLRSGAFDGDAGLCYCGEESVAVIEGGVSLSWSLAGLAGRSMLSRGGGVGRVAVETGV